MKRKNRFISIILVAMMLLSVVSSGFTAFAADEEGENPTPPAADNARDVSQLGEVPIYWARSQEWNYPELDQDINVNTLTLHNTNISSYKLSDLLGGRTDGKDAAGAPFTDGVDYNYSALDIAYADSVLSSKNALKNALAGVKDPDGAAEKVWALYSGEQKRPTVKSGIQYVWDGGYNTEGIAALNDLFFTDYAAEGGAVTYIYDYKHTFYHRVTDMFYVGEYSSEGVYAPGSVVKCADGEYYRYIGKGTASNPPVLGSPSNQADLFNGWERLDSLTEAPENFEENYNKDAYNRELGIYYPFTNTQEATDGVTFSRIGNPEKQGEWCTWVSHVAATNGQDSMNTTVRRFSGYFYLEDNIDVNDAYLALSDGTPLMAADDMFYLFINGYPIYAVSTKPTGEGTGKGNMPNILGYEKDDNNNILKDNIAIDPNAVMTLGKNGYDITGGVYQANESCNLPDTADCIVSPVGKEYDASGKFTGWSLRNKVKNPETGKYEYEIDPKTGKYVYYKSGDSVADGSTFAQIEKFGTYQESMLNNHDYAFAAYWHIHTNQTKLDISDYLKPGEANRIDIIAGDFNNGGGMTRPHLFTAGKYIESAEIGVNVEAYIDQKHKDTNTKFDHKISPEFAEGGSGIVKDAEPQPTGTPVYYEYTITNPDNQGSTDLKDVVLTDHNLNLEFSKDGIRKFTVNEDGTKTYGDPLPEDGLEFTVTKKDGTTTTGTTLEALKDAMGNNPGKTFEVGTTIVIRYPGTEIAYDAVGQHPTTVTVDGTSVKDTVGKVSASDSTYVIMEKATTDDWVVVDFGLPVELNVMQNDEFSWERDADNKPIIENGKEKVIGHVDNVAKGDFAETPDDGDFAAENVRGNYGYMSVSNRDDYSVRYVPTQFMDGTDLFTYQSTYGENDQTGYATVQVIPATNVYYEDNFNASDVTSGYTDENPAIIYTGNWSTVNTGDGNGALSSTDTNKNQSSDNSTDGTDNDNYGYDSIYDSDKFFSFDSAHEIGGAEDSSVETQAQYQEKLKANGGTITEGGKTYTDTYLDYLRYKNRHLGEDFNGEDATVEFKFRGTGFDIISTSTNDAGVMNCYVYPITVDADGNETVSGTPVKSIKVSNYYEVKNNDLYQIPVIAVKNLPYGKYKVKLVIEGLRAYPSKGNVIVLDGIRVYNPLGEEGDEHYTATEKNAVIYEVRDLLIGRTLGTEEKYNNDDIGANRIALFGTQNFYVGSNDDASDDASHPESGLISGGVALDRYNMDGPQNELYLTSVTTGVTFKYAPTEEHVEHSIPLTLQVEAKSPNGGSGMTVNCYFNTPSPEDGAKPATIGENNISCFKKTRTETVATGTQMYYDFTDLLPKIPQECIIEIVKTGESTATIIKGTNILSLSTIKVTEGAALSREVTNFNPVTPVMVGVGFAPAETSVYVGGMPQTVTLNKLYQIGTSEPLVVNASSVTFEPNASVSAAYDHVTGNVTVTPSVGAEPGTTKLVVNYTNEEKETFTAELNIKLEAPQEDVIEKVFFLGHEDATEIYLPIGAESTLIPVIKLKGSGELVWQESTGITLTETGFAPAEIVNDEATGRRSYVLKNAAAGDVKNVTLAASMLGGNKHNAAVAIRFIDTSVLNFNPIDVSYLPESTVVLKNGANKIDVSDAEVEYKEDEHGFTKVQSLLKAYKDKDVTLSITESDFSVEIDANDNLIVTVPKDSTKTKVKANVNVLVDGEVIGFFPVSFDYVAATSLTLDPPAANINYLMRGQSLTFTANVMPVSATNAVAWKIPATTPAGITITEDGNKLTVSVSDSFVLPEGENAVIYNGEIAASVQGVWGEQLAKVNIYDVNKAGEFSITETHPNYVANDIVISGDKYYVALGWVNTAPTPEDKLNWVYLGDVVTEPQVTISPASKTIFIGDSFGFTASTVNFEDASTELTWSSDNTTVATVAQDGTVTAVSEGTANIKVTSQAYPELYAEAVVKVVERPVVKSITITNTETELPKNKTLPLNVEVRDQKGELVDGAALAWHISPAIATIDASNVLIPSAEGKVSIYATYLEGTETITSNTYEIEITSAYNFTTAKITPVVTDVESGKTKYAYGAWIDNPTNFWGLTPVAITDTLTKICNVPETGESKFYFAFATSNNYISADALKCVEVTITAEGAVIWKDVVYEQGKPTYPESATKYGHLERITADNETGLYTYELSWTENAVPTTPVDSVTIAGADSYTVKVGDSAIALTATVLPAEAGKTASWSSNATSVATVDNTGKVTAVGAGTATITASAGGKSDSVTFTVLDPVTNVVVTGTSNGYVGESVELTAILVGSEYESISWACDAGAPVITQDSTDPTKVTLTFAEPVANATVTVTVNNTDEAIANGAATSVTDNTFSLVITQKPAEVKVNEITITGETQPVTGLDFTLTATFNSGAVYKSIKWTVNNGATTAIKGVDNGESVTLTAGDVGEEATVTVTVTNNDDSTVTQTHNITVQEAGAVTGPVNVKITDATTQRPYGVWFESGQSYPATTPVNEHKDNTKALEIGNTYYYSMSVYNSMTYIASYAYALKIEVASNGTVKASVGNITSNPDAGNQNYTLSYSDATTEFAVEVTQDGNNATLNFIPALPANEAIAPAKATLVGNGPAILGVAEDGEMTDIDTAAAYTMLTDSGVTPNVVASLGYSLVAKEGYTLLEDAVKSLVFEDDASDVIVVSINDAMTAKDSVKALIPAMESLLNTLHTLSPNAKIVLVGSRGAYTRFMEDAVKATGLGDIVFFMEDTSSAVVGEQAVIEQEELTNQIAAEVARILSLDEASDVPADAWTAITVYDAGDIVLYNGKKYECVTAHVAKNNSYNPEELPDYWKVIS